MSEDEAIIEGLRRMVGELQIQVACQERDIAAAKAAAEVAVTHAAAVAAAAIETLRQMNAVFQEATQAAQRNSNEWRGAMTDREKNFITRAEHDALMEKLDSQRVNLEQKVESTRANLEEKVESTRANLEEKMTADGAALMRERELSRVDHETRILTLEAFRNNCGGKEAGGVTTWTRVGLVVGWLVAIVLGIVTILVSRR